MNEHALEQLFDEFAQAYLRGDAPNVQSYLARAGAEQDDLGDMIDRFLQAVPAQAPTEEETVLMQARLEQEPPLMLLRIRRRLSRDAVVDTLLRTLGLDSGKREKVDDYYHQLETGLLDPEPVDRTVWAVLSDLLQANTRALAVRLTPHPASGTFRRLATETVEHARYLASWDEAPVEPDVGRSGAEPAPEPSPRDEVDLLFTGSGPT